MKKFFLIIILFFSSWGMAHSQEKVYLPIMLKQFPSGFKDNGWFLIKPVESTNYILNPSAEIAGNFSALGGATVTRSTTYQKYGLYSYRVQVGANGDGISLTAGTLTNVPHYATVRVRGILSNAVRFAAGVGIRQPELIERIDDNWNLYGTSFTAAEVNGHTAFRIYQIDGNGDYYIDGVQLEALSYRTTYIDGSQDGCEWLGAENASVSRRNGESKAGGRVVDFLEEYGFRIDSIVGAGASPVQVNIDSYAILPGGEFNSRKVQSRGFQIVGQFIADSERDLRVNRKNLRLEFETLNDQPTRIWYTHSEVQKEIAVHYTGGLEGDNAVFYGDWETIEDNQWGFRTAYTENAAVQVIAPNPYWQEVGESAILLDTEDSITFRTIAARLKDTGQWNPLGPPSAAGSYSNMYSIVEDGTYVYCGSLSTNFDGIAAADYIVRYNKGDSTWSALVALNNSVRAMSLASNGNLYVGGEFTNASGDADADYIAVWDGSSFSAVGVPNTGTATISGIYTIAIDNDGNVWVGGDFTDFANIAGADYIAYWDGSAWNAAGTGMDQVVNKIVVDKNNNIFAGGDFDTAGGVTAYRLAQWNGSAWSSLGTEATVTSINALAISPTTGLLYVGGSFSTIGGASANNIAIWNGTAFTNLSSGVNGQVNVIKIQTNTVYVGGVFSTAGGITLSDRIAQWNGSSWSSLDVDLPGTPVVRDILVGTRGLYIAFSTTGTGEIAGLVTANNEGSALAYPKITFTRSGGTSAIIKTLINERTNKRLLFDYSLKDGESLVIDLNPINRTVTSLPLGLENFSPVLSNSDVGQWNLLSGNNNITSFVDNTGATVTATMLWREQYDGYD